MVKKSKWTWITVFVRLVHTTLTLAVAASLLFTETSLKKSVNSHHDALDAIGYFSLLALSLSLYWIVCLSNPGYVPKRPLSKPFDQDESEEPLQVLSNGVRLRRCGFCGIEQPLRSRHCEVCDRCVRKFDHHCPWLDQCIGEGNHKYFWWFLLITTLLIGWSTRIVWNAIVYKPLWSIWLKQNSVLLLDMFILVLSGFVVLCLTFVHTYLMVRGLTTWECVSRERITYLRKLKSTGNPFHESYIKNIAVFLCRIGVMRWEKLYNIRVTNAVNTKHNTVSV